MQVKVARPGQAEHGHVRAGWAKQHLWEPERKEPADVNPARSKRPFAQDLRGEGRKERRRGEEAGGAERKEG